MQALSHPGSLILEEEAKGSVHAMTLQTLLQHLLIHEENKRKRRKREREMAVGDRMHSLVSACSPADFDSPHGPSKSTCGPTFLIPGLHFRLPWKLHVPKFWLPRQHEICVGSIARHVHCSNTQLVCMPCVCSP